MPVDVQTFTSGSGNWTKPSGATTVRVILVGAGGSGGGGDTQASATTVTGGGGGGGGGDARMNYGALGEFIGRMAGAVVRGFLFGYGLWLAFHWLGMPI